MEFIIQFLAEIFLQLFFEVLAEAGLHFWDRQKKYNPYWVSLGYILLGAILGGLSLILFPESFLSSTSLKIINLIITPIIIGALMAWIGRHRKIRSKDVIRLESFFYGYLFALSMALVRMLFTT